MAYQIDIFEPVLPSEHNMGSYCLLNFGLVLCLICHEVEHFVHYCLRHLSSPKLTISYTAGYSYATIEGIESIGSPWEMYLRMSSMVPSSLVIKIFSELCLGGVHFSEYSKMA